MKPLLIALLLALGAPLAAQHSEHPHPIPGIAPDPGRAVAWEGPRLLNSGLSTRLDILRARAADRLPAGELLSLAALLGVLLLSLLGDHDLRRRAPRRPEPVEIPDLPPPLRAVHEAQRVHQGNH